jgi:hypothetical protein
MQTMTAIRRTILALAVAAPQLAFAQVYSNHFETTGSENANLTAGGNLVSGLTRVSLPTDGAGLGSPNQSMWLGRNGWGVAKNSSPEAVTLSLSGLTSGSTYNVSFDLLVGSSWDGSAVGYGPDEFALYANSGANNATLLDATFSNCGLSNELCGASSQQSYSDATPLGGSSGPTFAPETGADFFWDFSGDYSQDYGIYYFGHGAGNPMLSFIADGSTASLVFTRLGTLSGDSGDEYWALDNIEVDGESSNAAPEPASIVLIATGLAGVAAVRRRDARV